MNLSFIKFDSGWLSEWSMEAVLKTVGLIAPGVRIPHHPKYTDVQVPAETGCRQPDEEHGCDQQDVGSVGDAMEGKEPTESVLNRRFECSAVQDAHGALPGGDRPEI
jgi:hypothetical protein